MNIDVITRYFQGERHEMLGIVGGSLAVTLLAGAFFVLARDQFSKSLLVTVLVSAALLSVTALSLLPRDVRLGTELAAAIQAGNGASAITGELARVQEIISKYQYYRYGASLLALLAVAAVVASRKGWVHGMAAGLLLLVVAQIVIDHYSEQRASRYHEQLVRAVPTDGARS
jgi:hypothetical protein